MRESAHRLFTRQGYHATGVNQILTEATAPKGSLYFHFPGGKQQLGVEAVQLGAAEIGALLDEVLLQAPDPARAVRMMAELLAARLADSGFTEGCPVATVALEAGEVDPLRAACADGYDGWLTTITRTLTDAGLAAHRAERLAVLILSALEGALILARVRRDQAPVLAVGDLLADSVRAALEGREAT